MPFPILDKANKIPIVTILKWYMERKKGKVVESRKEIQRRFSGLDWSVQKKVILAFLDAGVNHCSRILSGSIIIFTDISKK